MTQPSEREMLAGLKAGSQEAFRMLVELHSGTVYNVALRLLGDAEEAEDVLQETFISAYKGLSRFEGRSQLGTWLYRIAYNAALMRMRKRRIRTESLDEPLVNEDGDAVPRQFVDWSGMPDAVLLSRELRGVLDTALMQLPESQRSVFVLRDIEGLTTAEAAEVLGITETNAKVRLHRARLALRELLTTYLGPALASPPALQMPAQGELVQRAM